MPTQLVMLFGMVKSVWAVNGFVRNEQSRFFAISSHARQGEAQRRLSLTTGLGAKLRRFAVPSAFAFAIRTARDVFPTRHGLARLPCRASGEVAYLSTVFDAGKTVIRMY
ncbi:hypothetical protein [Dickeya fangzhongdai]|uniref:hypothetical protein n=1 Tax=Dickeya fangzhongdai TaxID=1778540 RepID=UPI0026DF895C|nr:hypothetical protein [Dickeya fangzhongdai]WKV52399.1 hypothetical protein PL145_09375 [Dickeya fangzhongdai]